KWPYAEDLTADFVYCRLHGAEELYVSGYTPDALDWWAARIRHWRRGTQPRDAKLISERKAKPGKRDVYVYFDNDAKVHAPFHAIDREERIVLFGDYDVDGITSLALLAEMIRGYGAAPDLFLPLRMEEGYGMSPESVERCCEQFHPQLLIAVDCGTSSIAEIAG